MKTKSKTSAIVPAATSVAIPATQPPAKKADIIAALVERAAVKHAALQKEANDKREAKKLEIKTWMLNEIKKNPDNFDIYLRSAEWTPEIHFEIKVIPASLKKLKAELTNIPHVRNFDAARVKREITAGLGQDATSRVQALLSNPDTVKKLDQTLESIGA